MKKLLLLLIVITSSCQSNDKRQKKPTLEAIISNSNDTLMKHVFNNHEYYEVQILYSEIIENPDGSVSFETQNIGVDSTRYFYPASTIKLPVSLFALEKAQNTSWIDGNTSFFVEGDSIATTINKEISKIFAVSDNEAYNILYEFLGRDEINDALASKGYRNSTIYHRLSVEDPGDRNIKPLVIFENDSVIMNTEAMINERLDSLEMNMTQRGIAYYDDDELVEHAKSFAEKNYFSLYDQHHMIQDI
ncbi:MAG: class A beta-lactamase-related serine hydrolase, partial [Crocinitomicaceae bacterium]|nr:class A beta-lactamase-related serine hydrolase [Crocinitomicaceae bacterium]